MLRLVAGDAGAKASPLPHFAPHPPHSNYIKSSDMKEYILRADISHTLTHVLPVR